MIGIGRVEDRRSIEDSLSSTLVSGTYRLLPDAHYIFPSPFLFRFVVVAVVT